jgi:ribonucleoside-diphosphate reductase alpha chain
MRPLAAISQQIWDMKYRFKAPDGAAIDKSIEDTWRRVANALAEAEAPEARAQWAARFHTALEDFKFIPAGRIVAGAGTARHVTLFNCFVMGTVPDDMAGIFAHLREAALTMQQGGGIGYDFSTLRPKGAPVKGVGADASGPLTFMDVWDSMCRTIMSAGHRRGAMMATLRCDHPDIEAFVEAKREPGRLRMFNLSVLVTDAFMTAVKEDAPWPLTFNGTDYRTLRARELWDKIMRATYAYAEPGVIFIDRINRANNLWYVESIAATNPCVTADTWVHTDAGPRQVRALIGVPFRARLHGVDHDSGREGFFATGRKPVVKLATREGFALRLTADHKVRAVSARTRWRRDEAWIPAGALKPGDEIVLNDHRASPAWAGAGDFEQGFLLGLLIGDGTLKDDAAVLSAWKPRAVANGDSGDAAGIEAVMRAAMDAAAALPHRADWRGWHEIAGRNEWRLKSTALRDLAAAYGLVQGAKTVTPDCERASSEFQRGLLRGLFDTDGSVQGSQSKGVSVRLAQSDAGLLEAVQRMLLRFGIVSTLYRDRRPAGMRTLPDGKGGTKDYPTEAQHELAVANANLARFAERIGFADSDKAGKLARALGAYARKPNAEPFVATVASVEPDGEETVYDVRVPGPTAFDANGLHVHNCGEQPLPPYGACLLGSINLAALVRDPFTAQAALDEAELERIVPLAIRMMDNVTDVSRFPLEQQAKEAQAKRRIGLGVTGLADALILCGLRYGSESAVAQTERWMARIRTLAYSASVELARLKGPFPLFDREKYLQGEAIRALEPALQDAIAEHGIRNALLTSIAPTGTISLMADNVSSGLEPVFSFSYTRTVLMPDGTRKQEEVSDHAYRLYKRMFGENAQLPDYFVDAQRLTPAEHVVMQAAVQKYIDASISKTINCPEELSFEAFKDIYAQAYALGCKGCTTYRPNDVTGSVLTVKKDDKKKGAPVQQSLPLAKAQPRPADTYEASVVYMTRPLDRPEALPGQTYKIKWADAEHALYITINDVVTDGRRRPFEVFINSKNMEHYAWTVALTRMISAVFRRGGDVSFVVEELKAVFDPRGGQWMGGRYVPSLLAAIGEVIERHMVQIGFLRPGEALASDPAAENPPLALASGGTAAEAAQAVAHSQSGGGSSSGAAALFSSSPPDGSTARLAGARHCPKCTAPTLIRMEGCDTCTTCGYSKCG